MQPVTVLHLDRAVASLRRKRLPCLDDARSGLAEAHINATLAAILADLDPAAFARVAQAGPAALAANNNDVCPLARAAVDCMGAHFSLSWNFEENLFGGEWTCLPEIAIEVITGLPTTWEMWDEVLDNLAENAAESPERWSLPVFYYALRGAWDSSAWYDAAEAFNWPDDLIPKYWRRKERWEFDDDKFIELLHAAGLEMFAIAYKCVFCYTGNLFIDYDYGESGEMELPQLSVAGVRQLIGDHQAAQELLAQLESACEATDQNPAVLRDVLKAWNAALAPMPKKRPRTLAEVFREERNRRNAPIQTEI